MIRPTFLRELSLDPDVSACTGLRYLSAASGVVAVAGYLYVVADDERALGVFELNGPGGGTLIPLLPGRLPDEASARKAAKPDFEALVRLPALAGHCGGALLALGSGSRSNRGVGVMLGLDAKGAIDAPPRMLDLSGLYRTLEGTLPSLNIEGAVVVNDRLRLFHRGSKGDPDGAVIDIGLAEVVAALTLDRAVLDAGPITIRRIGLGFVSGVALGFTDAAALPDGRIVFSAVAEASEDSYRDGPCVAAVIGLLGVDGTVQSMQRLDPLQKVEGIHAEVDGGVLKLLMVTDADDREVPARVLTATVALDSFA